MKCKISVNIFSKNILISSTPINPAPGVRSRLAAEARDKRTVILDVGGERFIATRDILAVFPATRCSLVTRHT